MFVDPGKAKLKRIADGVSTLEEENAKDWEAFQAILDGVKSVPESIKDGLSRIYTSFGPVVFYDFNEFLETWDENFRGIKVLVSALKSIHTHRGPVAEAVTIIFAVYLNHLPKCAQETVSPQLGLKGLYYGSRYVTTRAITSSVNKLSRIIINKILSSVVFQKLSQQLSTGIATGSTKVGAILTIAIYISILDDAAQASRRLKERYPLIYNKLRPNNLDMIYFLVEQPMEVFIQGIQRARIQPENFSKIAEQLFCKKKHNHSIATNLLYTPANKGLLELSKLIDRNS